MTARRAFPYLLFLFVAPVCIIVAPKLRERAEVALIQAHLARAERLARSHDVSDWSAARRAARERHLARLRSYRERGVFPHNDRARPVAGLGLRF